jgi:ribosomal protein L11 methyltransferase
MEWNQFVLDIGDLDSNRVEELFLRHGAQAVTLSDAADDPILEPAPGETPLWNRTRMTGLFGQDTNLDALRLDLISTFSLASLPAHHVEILGDRAWEREWLKDFKPVCFGSRLWVSPVHMEVSEADAVVLKMDPGLAFGTGTHETTSLCLRWLDREDVSGKTILDYGCGSGILAIAALLLGAAHATAYDIDPQAVTATLDNAQRNGVADRLTAGADATPTGQYDIVLANILAETLKKLASQICERLRPGGSLLLSGILGDQADDVIRAYAPWIRFDPPTILGDWVRLDGRKVRD